MSSSNERTYAAYGLRIESPIPLSGLSRHGRAATSTDDTADIEISIESLPRCNEIIADSIRVYDGPDGRLSAHRTETGIYWLHDKFGTVRVRDGRQITIDPVDAAHEGAIRQLILGPGLCTAVIQRGFLVLHASVALVDGTTVAFAGKSGRGKSTAAGACYKKGHDIVSDDLAVLNTDGQTCEVRSGYPRLRLEEGVAAELGLSNRIASSTGRKGSIDVSDGFRQGRRRLDRIYFLEPSGEFSITEIPGPVGVFELLQASYSLYRDTDTQAQHTHLEDCGSVARACFVRRLTRPRSPSRIDELVELVESDLSCGE